jgi:hypothetical protein
MPSFSTQFGWRKTGTTVAVELLTVVSLGFAVVGYVEWSSDAAVADFMRAASASDLDHSNVSSAPVQSRNGRTGCPQGKRKLPTTLMDLP